MFCCCFNIIKIKCMLDKYLYIEREHGHMLGMFGDAVLVASTFIINTKCIVEKNTYGTRKLTLC